MQYFYNKVQGGFRWNMLQRIKHEVGLLPIQTCDIDSQTCLEFDRELTAQEKASLDNVMNNSPTLPPLSPSGTVFKVKDLWETLSQFNVKTGVTFNVFYSESTPGSGVFDIIELHASQQLDLAKQAEVKLEYGKLIS